MLIILYGPSCAGKTTIQRGFIDSFVGAKAVRCFQTRAPRDCDVGRVYVDVNEYEELLRKEEIAISNEHFGGFYGTSRKDLEASMVGEQIFLLDFLIKDRELLDPYGQKKILIVPDSIDQVLSQMEKAGRSSRREKIIEDYRTHYAESHLKKLEREGFLFLRNRPDQIERAVKDLRDILK